MIFKRNIQDSQEQSTVVLLLQVPRSNEKKELAAEQMLAAIHGLLTKAESGRIFDSVQHEKISFEIAGIDGRIGFYIWVPALMKQYVQDQIYAQYPTVHISEVEDYAGQVSGAITMVSELKLIAPDPLPIKTFPSFEVDPLAGVTATLAQLEEGENAWVQVVVRPAQNGWYKKSERYAQNIRGGGGSNYVGLLGALIKPPEAQSGSVNKLAEHESVRAKAAEEKSHKLAYEATIRIVYSGLSDHQARMRLQSIVASFKQYNSTYLNGFAQYNLSATLDSIDAYSRRRFSSKPMTLNIEELASLYHLPHTNVETPNILWSNATTAEPPANLPIKIDASVSPIAHTNFRGHNTKFGLPRLDRGRHTYIIGQTGTGKSGLLELLTSADIESGEGFAVIDPHGDYALNVLRRIPRHRMQDVIYFNPADSQFPIAFNPLEIYDPKLRTHVSSELIGVLKRMFDSWGPRLEYILRYSILALLDYPEATMLDITKILTDKKFRDEVLEYVTDPVVKNFWTVEFASWNDKFAAEAVAPVLNKIGAFTANPLVRNIIGQPTGSFNIREIMDQRKILIVNLSRGLIGEDNAGLLGALIVTKIQMAAMSRADVAVEKRTPFYLYVDEFQNFATDSFATILSEARKYALNLTVANQYTAQMMQSVKDAVFGNVGCIVSFRTSADDARGMMKYFEPKFTDYDLVHMHNRHFAISMSIGGEKVQAFSAVTTDLRQPDSDNTQAIIASSRKLYASDITEVEQYIDSKYHVHTSSVGTSNKSPSSPKQPPQSKQKATASPLSKNINPETLQSGGPVITPETSPEFTPKLLKKTQIVSALGVIAEEATGKPKRKRKRLRKKAASQVAIKPVETKKTKTAKHTKKPANEGELENNIVIKLR